MIGRIWHGWTTQQNADAYERLLRTEVLPSIAGRGIEGYRGASLHRREMGDEVEFLTTLSFDSLDAVRAFAGDDHEASYVPPAARELLTRFDERAAHYVAVLDTGPRTSLGQELAAAVRATVRGPMWHGPSLRDVIEGVTPEQAWRHPVEGAHSIWELVHHVGAWADIACQRILGRSVTVTPERNFPPVGEPTADAWRESIEQMEARYETLAATVGSMAEAALRTQPAASRPQAELMVRGVVEHGVYHAGQISLLRRALGIAPPPS